MAAVGLSPLAAVSSQANVPEPAAATAGPDMGWVRLWGREVERAIVPATERRQVRRVRI